MSIVHRKPFTFGARHHRYKHYQQDADAILRQLPVRDEADTSGWYFVLHDGRILGQGNTRVGARRQAADRVMMFGVEAVRKGEW